MLTGNYLQSPEAMHAIQYVFGHFLNKPYDNKFKKFDPTDWELDTPHGKIPRPNHGIVHTLRVASLVPIIAEFLKAYSKNRKFAALTVQDIQKAQYLMLFSVIGRKNDISFGDASKLYKEGKTKSHLYTQFKEKTKRHFRKYVKKNVPKIFTKNELNYWAEALDTGKPGVTSPTGILMALAHDLDLMRCYSPNQFKGKIQNLIQYLGNDQAAKTAAAELLDYVYASIKATGDRCIGYGYKMTYDVEIFSKCSKDPKECLKQIQNVPIPVIESAQQISNAQTLGTSSIKNTQHYIVEPTLLDINSQPAFAELNSEYAESFEKLLSAFGNEKEVGANLNRQYQQTRTEKGLKGTLQSLNIHFGRVFTEKRTKDMSDLATLIVKLQNDKTLNSHEKGVILVSALQSIISGIRNESENKFESRLSRICEDMKAQLTGLGVNQYGFEHSKNFYKAYKKGDATSFRQAVSDLIEVPKESPKHKG